MTRSIAELEQTVTLLEDSCAQYKEQKKSRALSSCLQSLDKARLRLAEAKAEAASE